MKYLFLLLFFIPSISIGENKLSNGDVKLLSVKRAMNSLVMVTASSAQFEEAEKTIIETVGFIAEDSEGHIGVVTSFGFVDKTVYIAGENSILVYNKVNDFFKVKAIKNISPVNNLVFLQVKGDITEGGKRPPLTVADSHEPNEQLFYALRKLSASSHSWFQTEAVQKTVSLSHRLDFLIRDSYRDIKANHAATLVSIPILNQKGEIVSFVSDGADHVLYGTPLRDTQGFLQSSVNCSFIRGCVIEARKALYEQVLFRKNQPNKRAGYMLMLYTAKPAGSFEKFMNSIEITYSVRIKGDLKAFRREAAQWDAKLYYYWLTNHERMPERKRREHFEFLEQRSSVKQLAEEGHPHFQYLMGSIYLHLGNSSQAEYWFRKSAGNGYIPGLWESMRVHLSNGLSIINSFAERGYIPAYRLLLLLRQDFRKVKGFLDRHDKKGRGFSELGPPDVFPQFQEVRDQVIVAALETDASEPGRSFSEGLTHLETGLSFMQQFAEQNYDPVKGLQGYFKTHIKRKLRWGRPIYIFSQESERACKNEFSDHSIPAG